MNKYLPNTAFLLDISWMVNLYFWAGRSSDEENSGIRGIVFQICKIINNFKPEAVIACIDAPNNFRKQICPLYKGNRPEKEEDFSVQLQQVKELLDIIGLQSICINTYESDDIMATICENNKESNTKIVMVSADKDMKVLLQQGKIGIYRKSKGKPWHFYSQEACEKEHAIRIDQFMEFLILVGDASDNIKTVDGIGPIKASKLLQTYNTIDGIYEHLSELSPSVQKSFENFKPRLDISRNLVRLVRNVPGVPEKFDSSNKTINRTELNRILRRNDIGNLETLILETFGA